MITEVKITLDDNVPEDMLGIIRCGHVLTIDKNGDEESHEELIDNTEYHSTKELIADISKRLNVDPEIVSIDE